MGRYYFNETVKAHFCRDCGWGHYKMPGAWIDTDNKVWGEPYHLYGWF